MPHEHQQDVIRTRGDKLERLVGHRGEHPWERASRIAGSPVDKNAQGDAAAPPEEVFIAAPPRQISNYGKVKGV